MHLLAHLRLLAAAVLLTVPPVLATASGSLDSVVHSLPGGGSIRIVKCYPQGLMRASCQNFDDGTLGSDWPVLAALHKRGIPATFFVNSTHPQSRDAVRFPRRYAGFEIASHGANHKGLAGLTEEQVKSEIQTDRKLLSEAFDQIIDGFAYPYGSVPKDPADLEKLETQLRGFGLIYARWTGATKAYAPPADFMRWVPDCGFMEPLETFLAQPAEDSVRVRMCFTHSIDFARGQMSFEAWEHMLGQLAENREVWNVTMRDYARYVTALRALEITETGLRNDTPISVWVRVNGKPAEVPAQSTLRWALLQEHHVKS